MECFGNLSTLKFIWQKKCPLIAKSTLKRRVKKEPTVPNIKTHYILWQYMQEQTAMEQNQEPKDRLMYIANEYDKGSSVNQWGKNPLADSAEKTGLV